MTAIAGTSSTHKRAPRPPLPHDRSPADRGDERRVVHEQAETRHPRLAPFALVELHHVERPEHAPRAPDARGDDRGHAAEMRTHVVERPLAVHRRAPPTGRRAACGLSMHASGPEIDGEPDAVAVEHVVAVRARERDAVVGRDEGAVLEPARG